MAGLLDQLLAELQAGGQGGLLASLMRGNQAGAMPQGGQFMPPPSGTAPGQPQANPFEGAPLSESLFKLFGQQKNTAADSMLNAGVMNNAGQAAQTTNLPQGQFANPPLPPPINVGFAPGAGPQPPQDQLLPGARLNNGSLPAPQPGSQMNPPPINDEGVIQPTSLHGGPSRNERAAALGLPKPGSALEQQQDQPRQPGAFNRIGQGINDNAMMFMGLGSGIMTGGLGKGLEMGAKFSTLDQKQGAVLNVYSALRTKGLDHASALAAAQNPEILKNLLPSLYGPKQSPTTHEVETPLGKRTAFYDTKTGTYLDLLTGKPMSEFVNSAPPPASTPFNPGPPPPGVNPDEWRKEQAKKIADDEQKLREQGQGALDLLPDAMRVMGRIEGPGKNAIGPYQGAPWYNEFIRAPGAAMPLNPWSEESRKNLGTFNQLKADLTRLSSSNLKAQFGARPTNIEVQMNKETFGGMQSADSNTAASILGERMQNSYHVLEQNLERGYLKPETVPADVAQFGISRGWLNPKYLPQAAQAQPQQQQQNAPGQHDPLGIR